MRVYVINLVRSESRRAAMSAQLDALGVAHTIFPAVDPSAGDLEPFLGRVRPDRRKGIPITPGEAGCFASHYLLWQECVRLNEPIAILEDDLALDARFPEVLRLAGQEIARGRVMIRLFGYYPWRTRKLADIGNGYSVVRYLKGPKGCQCQVISPEGARRLLRHAEIWREPLDFYLDRYWLHGVASLAITPFRIEHLNVPSDVGQRSDGIFSTRRSLLKLADSARRKLFNARCRVLEMLA